MLDKSTIEFLHSGCAVLIGTVDAEGQPHASRGWGLTVDGAQLRVLADAGDPQLLSNLQPGVLVAITVASVLTFKSRQMKGRVLAMDTVTDVDDGKLRQYVADFTNDIHEVDRLPMEQLRRWADRQVLPFTVEIDSSFDQTPGPSAGTPLDTR